MLLHVVDAADPDRDVHVATTDKLLAELELHQIPRIVVLNKADQVPAVDHGRLLGGRSDAVLLSATERETTRGLLGMIAERLAQRWERAATVPVAVGQPSDEAGW